MPLGEPNAKLGDGETITVDLGLRHIGLLASEGVHANRSDVIRTVIRNQVERRAEITRRSIAPAVSPELAGATIVVPGSLRASRAVKEALGDRLR